MKNRNLMKRPHFVISLLMSLFAATSAFAQEGLRMYGYVAYANNWTEDNYGMYTFNTVPPVNVERMPYGGDGPVGADGGGCYYDGKYYAVTYAGFMGMLLAEYCVYNTETWEMEKYIPSGAGSVSADMDYDVTTGFIYGAFYNDNFDGFVFGRMDPATGVRTAICNLNRIFFGIAVNSKGEVYGMDEEGGLYKFDKQTGARTKIGDTGVYPQYLGSATFYHKTDELYWSVMTESTSTIYKVNTETAEVTKVCQMPHAEEVQGLYIPVPAAEPAAPAVATGLKANFEGPSLTGTITFTMPTTTYDENSQLEGELAYDIYVNDEFYVTGSAKPGEEVTERLSVKRNGEYRFTVRPRNQVGQAPVAKVSLWVGYDVPKAVQNLKAEEGSVNGEVVVTWSVPTETMHGGYLDTNSIQYGVTRIDGENRLWLGSTYELTYTDHIVNNGPITPYSYEVVPYIIPYEQGEAVRSNPVSVGSALKLPYIQDFSKEDCLDLFTIVDRHEDGKTWEYDATFQAARAQYDWTNAKNEWLITPPLFITAQRICKVQFDTWCRDGYTERIEVKMGQGKKYTDMTKQVMPRTEISNATPETRSFLVKIDADGDYRFGFHALSDVDKWWLYVDNVRIEAGPLLGTPNAVTNLRVKTAEQGKLSATLSFNAPTTTVESTALSSLSGIKLLRNGKLIETLEAKPGEAVTYTDNEAVQGTNHYTIIPVNEYGEGLEKTDSAYVGVDIPVAPTNVRLRKVNDKPVLTWEAPTKGVNGAYVNPEGVVYYVVRSDNTQVASQIHETSYTDNSLNLVEGQAFVSYAIYAQNAAGLDPEQYAMSNEVCFGTPHEMPFHESFKGVSIEQGPWTWDIVDGDPWIQIVDSGSYPSCTAADNDGGLVAFEPENDGDEAILYSSNISLVGAEKPKLSFWYYNNPGTYDKISVRVRLDDDAQKTDEVAYINMTSISGEEGWTECVCDLSKYIGHRIQLAFDFACRSDFYTYLDNITVSGLRHDLPMVNDLCAEVIGSTVLLTWSEPIDEQGLGFIGYNVYRNGKLLNTDEPLVDPMYEDSVTNLDNNTKYQVTVVYEEGETTYSNAVFMNADGVVSINASEERENCYTLDGIKQSTAPHKGAYILGKHKYIRK